MNFSGNFALLLLILSISFGIAGASDALSSSEVDQQILQARKREQAAKLQIQSLNEQVASLRESLEKERNAVLEAEEKVYKQYGVTRMQADTVFQKLAQLSNQIGAFTSQYSSVPKDLNTAIVWAEYQLNTLQQSPATKHPTGDSLLTQARVALNQAKAELLLLTPSSSSEEIPSSSSVEVSSSSAESPSSSSVLISPSSSSVQIPLSSSSVYVPSSSSAKVIAISSSSVSAPAMPADASFYVVGQANNGKDVTLWGISQIVYGDPSKWQRIWRANAQLITNPDRIEVGTQLVIPAGPMPRPW